MEGEAHQPARTGDAHTSMLLQACCDGGRGTKPDLGATAAMAMTRRALMFSCGSSHALARRETNLVFIRALLFSYASSVPGYGPSTGLRALFHPLFMNARQDTHNARRSLVDRPRKKVKTATRSSDKPLLSITTEARSAVDTGNIWRYSSGRCSPCAPPSTRFLDLLSLRYVMNMAPRHGTYLLKHPKKLSR